MKKILLIAGLVIIIMTGEYIFEKQSKSIYPTSPDLKAAVELATDELLPNKITDLAWYNYFYLFETPIVIDAANLLGTWGMAVSGGSFGGSRSAVILKSGSTANQYARMTKDVTIQEFINLNQPQRFRTSFSLDPVTNVLAYISRGFNSAENYYGFKIEDGNLYGASKSDNGTEQTVLLSPITAGVTYTIEALFAPGVGIIFRLLKPFSDVVVISDTQKFEEVGVISMPLPIDAGVGLGIETNLFNVYLKNKTTSTEKELSVSYVEYVQKR